MEQERSIDRVSEALIEQQFPRDLAEILGRSELPVLPEELYAAEEPLTDIERWRSI